MFVYYIKSDTSRVRSCLRANARWQLLIFFSAYFLAALEWHNCIWNEIGTIFYKICFHCLACFFHRWLLISCKCLKPANLWNLSLLGSIGIYLLSLFFSYNMHKQICYKEHEKLQLSSFTMQGLLRVILSKYIESCKTHNSSQLIKHTVFR